MQDEIALAEGALRALKASPREAGYLRRELMLPAWEDVREVLARGLGANEWHTLRKAVNNCRRVRQQPSAMGRPQPANEAGLSIAQDAAIMTFVAHRQLIYRLGGSRGPRWEWRGPALRQAPSSSEILDAISADDRRLLYDGW
jgi:hypothetical protein